jgi:hypothetical protein
LKDYKYVIDSFGSVPGDQKTMNQWLTCICLAFRQCHIPRS